MNNYFGIGLDAKISLDFNNKRDEHPEKCRYVLLVVSRGVERGSKKPAQEGRDYIPGLANLGRLDIRKSVMCVTVVGCLLSSIRVYNDTLEEGDMSVLQGHHPSTLHG